MEAFLIHMGVSPVDVFAGGAGGMLAGLVTTGAKPTVWNVLVSIVAGLIVAGYGGPVLPTYVGVRPSPFSSFVIGVGGVPICRILFAGISKVKWSPFEHKIGD